MKTRVERMPRSKAGDRLVISVGAQSAISQVCARDGLQHLILSWPAGATMVPASMHQAAMHEAIVGHVSRCPIYVDLQQFALFRNRRLILDVDATSQWRTAGRAGARPSFILSTLSARSRSPVPAL
jgi:hypothetical protein